jgi:hypothetical protein
MSNTGASVAARHPGRGIFLLGILLAVGGIAIFAAIFSQLHILQTPWYMPILATAGAMLAVMALARQQTIARWIGTSCLVALAGFQWFAFLFMLATPAYAGPAMVGQAFPQFATKKYDGSAFTHENLKSDKNAILLFFRGRW